MVVRQADSRPGQSALSTVHTRSADSRDGEAEHDSASHLTLADRVGMLRLMVLTRAVEERGLSLYKQGRVPGSFYDGRGQEATAVGATFALALREATDQAVRRGVPKQAAIDFIIGHLNIELAIAFGIFPEGKFSDGALQAIDNAKPVIFRDGWLDRVFAPAAVLKSVKDICEAPAP